MAEIARYQRLNPAACGLAAAITELVIMLLVGWPMFGMGGMMSGYGGVMGRGLGMGLVWWLGGAVIAALAGAFFAWVYNGMLSKT